MAKKGGGGVAIRMLDLLPPKKVQSHIDTAFFFFFRREKKKNFTFDSLIYKNQTMISAIQWIRKGAAAQQPKKYDLNDEEYARISKLAADQLEDAKEELKAAEAMAVE